MFLQNISMAFASIRGAKVRSLLTILGIVIGISSVVSILAIGNGVKKAVQDQITGVVGANAVTVTSGKIDLKSGGGAQSSVGASTLTEQDVTELQKVKHVSSVAPLGIISGVVTNGSRNAGSALLLATTPDFNRVHAGKFDQGGFFTSTKSKEVVLGNGPKQSLFGDENAIGKLVTIRGTQFTVVGVLQAADASATSGLTGGGGLDDAIFMPLESAKTLTNGGAQILRMLVQIDSPDNVNSTVEAMKKVMLADHGNQEDFSILTQKDILSTVDTVLGLITTFIVAIASISLLVGGIGIMNIMLVSVTERTREIGIRKAIGASPRTILTQFLIEAIVLTLLGGVIGVALAIVQSQIGGHLAKITPVYTPGAFALAVGVSVLVGIIFGIAPAFKAARMRPIQALRYI